MNSQNTRRHTNNCGIVQMKIKNKLYLKEYFCKFLLKDINLANLGYRISKLKYLIKKSPYEINTIEIKALNITELKQKDIKANNSNLVSVLRNSCKLKFKLINVDGILLSVKISRLNTSNQFLITSNLLLIPSTWLNCSVEVSCK